MTACLPSFSSSSVHMVREYVRIGTSLHKRHNNTLHGQRIQCRVVGGTFEPEEDDVEAKALHPTPSREAVILCGGGWRRDASLRCSNSCFCFCCCPLNHINDQRRRGLRRGAPDSWNLKEKISACENSFNIHDNGASQRHVGMWAGTAAAVAVREE